MYDECFGIGLCIIISLFNDNDRDSDIDESDNMAFFQLLHLLALTL